MRKWLKSWWFSIVMWLFAIFIPTWTIIIINLFDEDLIFLTMVLISCITPTLMLIGIGAAHMPRKEKEND